MTAARYQTVERAPPGAPWIALVHGVSQDHRVFDRQVEAFAADHRLILIDLPGHGLSTELPGPYGVQEYADSIAGALAAAGIGRTHFWGTHIGAGAGLLLACQTPDRFESLVLEAPVFPGRPIPVVAEMLAKVSEIVRVEGFPAARETWWQEGRWFDVMRAHPEACRAAEQQAIIADFSGKPLLDSGLITRPIAPIDEDLKALAVPTLIVNGEHDLPAFFEVAEALAALIPGCRRAVIEGGGGFPLWELPDRVNPVVRAFLEALPAEAGA